MSERTALERCVGDPRLFADEHWGRRPLMHRPPGGFGGLLDLDDVDHLVTGSLLRAPAFRMVRDGEGLDPSTYTNTVRIGGARVERTARPDRVLNHFARGATIVLQALHRQWPPVAAFCRDLELALTHPVQANAYVTPPTSKGFSVHHDTHDVFVIQTHGRKEWRVYPPLVEMAGPSQPWSEELGDPGSPIMEVELRPGDCLYVPRGFPHDAEAREEISVHVTVGITSYTWGDLWSYMFGRLGDDVRFREALPVGFAADQAAVEGEMTKRLAELHSWLDDVATPDVAEGFARRFWRSRRPILSGQMDQLERMGAVDLSTPLRKREGSVFRVYAEGEEAVVVLGFRELRMPGFAGRALRYIAETDLFAPADIPGLDEPGRLVLARRLLREGGIEVVGER